jgi:hypothetical protein
MNAVLPYLMDRMSRFIVDKYYCENAEIAFSHVLGINVPRFGFPDSSGYNNNARNPTGYGRDWEGYDRRGYDINGFKRDGFNDRGFNKDGFNKDGYDRFGHDKDGFNKDGRDVNGHTREEHVATLVTGWSLEFAAAIAVHVAQRAAAEPAVEPVAAKPVKKAAAKKAAPVKKAPAKKVAPAAMVAGEFNPFVDVVPRRRHYDLAQ